MRTHGNAPGRAPAGREEHDEAEPIVTQASALRVRAFDLAAAFVADTADDPRHWTIVFDAWAQERGLSLELRRAVRTEIVRRRFGADAPQRRRP